MGRLAKIISIGCIGLIAAAALGYSFAKPSIEAWLVSSIRGGLSSHGIRSQIDDLRIVGMQGKASRVVLNFPPGLFSLEAGEILITPELGSLFSGQIGGGLRGVLYGGTVRTDLRHHTSNGTAQKGLLFLDSSLSGVQLARHPQIRALGITSGTLNFTVKQLELVIPKQGKDVTVNSGELTIQIEGLERPQATTFKNGTFIPPISALDLQLLALKTPSGIAIEKFELNSSLGSASGTGQLEIASGNIVQSFYISLNVALVDTIGQLVGGFLPAISDNTLKSDSRSFNLELKGDRGVVTIRLAPATGK